MLAKTIVMMIAMMMVISGYDELCMMINDNED